LAPTFSGTGSLHIVLELPYFWWSSVAARTATIAQTSCQTSVCNKKCKQPVAVAIFVQLTTTNDLREICHVEVA